MREWTIATIAGVALAVAGCGSKPPPPPLTDEVNRKIAEEDKAVEDEESHGTAGKTKVGKPKAAKR